MEFSFATLAIAAGAVVGYIILQIAIKKLFSNGKEDIKQGIKDLWSAINLLRCKLDVCSEKYVLYDRYKEDYNKIDGKLDELIRLYYKDQR